jgi:TrmH family RNA methyltransferase
MLSKAKIKWIHSLNLKKNRKELHLFVAEGHKLVTELLPLMSCRFLTATAEWLQKYPDIQAAEIAEASLQELNKASNQQHPQEVLAVFEIPDRKPDLNYLKNNLTLALDNIQDPGNLGTIVRTADWFGINTLLCSVGCADAYNPKSVQASMGSIARVAVHYVKLEEFIPTLNVPVFGTFLEGKNLYEFPHLPQAAVILMGNESKGISGKLKPLVNEKLYIPKFPPGSKRAESLNVSIATGIICAAFRRSQTNS